jgi:hypothetical protein
MGHETVGGENSVLIASLLKAYMESVLPFHEAKAMRMVQGRRIIGTTSVCYGSNGNPF